MADNDNRSNDGGIDAELRRAVDRVGARRPLSIDAATFARLEAHCAATGRSMSSVVEQLVNAHLDSNPL